MKQTKTGRVDIGGKWRGNNCVLLYADSNDRLLWQAVVTLAVWKQRDVLYPSVIS